MTNEELAKHWNVSIDEVNRISNLINERYYLCLGQKKSDQLWYGLLYEKVPEARPVREIPEQIPRLVASSVKGYKTENDAVDAINGCMDIIQIPEKRARLMGVPQDAFKSLKKLVRTTNKQNERNNLCVRSCLERRARG